MSFETSALIILVAALGRLLWRGPSLCPGPMPQGVSYVHTDHELANTYIRKPQAGPLHGSLVTWVSEDLTGMMEG